MVQTIVYNGSFDGFLGAVFDVYEHKFTDVNIVPAYKHLPLLFAKPHLANLDLRRSHRVWKALQKKLTSNEQDKLHLAFLSELNGIENKLLRYIQDVFASDGLAKQDADSKIVQHLHQTAEKVLREQQQLQNSVGFQQASDGLSFAVVEPEYNVLPLLAAHYQTTMKGQRWLLFDARRRYGMYCNTKTVTTVQARFAAAITHPSVNGVYNESEALYQLLWKKQFKGLRPQKELKLYLQRMPRKYINYTPHRSTAITTGGLQERLTNWTYKRA